MRIQREAWKLLVGFLKRKLYLWIFLERQLYLWPFLERKVVSEWLEEDHACGKLTILEKR